MKPHKAPMDKKTGKPAVYKDTPNNRRLGRVGKPFGSEEERRGNPKSTYIGTLAGLPPRRIETGDLNVGELKDGIYMGDVRIRKPSKSKNPFKMSQQEAWAAHQANLPPHLKNPAASFTTKKPAVAKVRKLVVYDEYGNLMGGGSSGRDLEAEELEKARKRAEEEERHRNR